MTPQVQAALISVAGEQLRGELQERARRTQRAEDAEEVLKRYREPLAACGVRAPGAAT